MRFLRKKFDSFFFVLRSWQDEKHLFYFFTELKTYHFSPTIWPPFCVGFPTLCQRPRNLFLYLFVHEREVLVSWFLFAFSEPWRLDSSRRFFIVYCTGVTTSRATSGGWRKDGNTSGQRRNKFSTSYRDISVIVGENNSVVRPKYQQYTSLNKMLSNFSKVLMAQISFTAFTASFHGVL